MKEIAASTGLTWESTTIFHNTKRDDAFDNEIDDMNNPPEAPAKNTAPLMDSLKPGSGGRFAKLISIVSILVSISFIGVMPQTANDFWLQAKVGELIWQSGEIPQTLLFPFTPIHAAIFNAHEWLSSVVFHGMLAAVGEGNLPLVLGGLWLLLFAAVAKLAHLRSHGNLALALILGLVAVGVANYRNFLRPELFSLILLTGYLFFLEKIRLRTEKKYVFAALLTVVVWANIHGSFILAPVLSLTYAAGAFIDHMRGLQGSQNQSDAFNARVFGYLSIAVLASCLVNPFGLDLISFVFEFSDSSLARAHIVEWLPTFDTRFYGIRGWWIGLSALGLTALFVAVRRRELTATDLLIFLLFLLMAVRAVRFLVYIGIVCAFVLSGAAPQDWKNRAGQLKLYLLGTFTSLTVLALAMTYGNAMHSFPHVARYDTSFTAPMIRELHSADLQGNVLNTYDFGAELVYRAYPRLKPSIDSRVDSYGDDYYLFHRRLFTDDALLRQFTNEHNVSHLLLDLSDFIRLTQLSSWTDGLWEIRFQDHKAILLVRSTSKKPARPGV